MLSAEFDSVKNRRVALRLIAVCLFLVSSARASDEIEPWSITSGVVSKYLGTIGGVFYDHPILVTDVTFANRNVYAGIWNSTALGPGEYGETYGDEFDFYAGWSHEAAGFRYEITGMYFLISKLREIDDDLWVIDQKVSIQNCPVVQPYFKLRCFNPVGANSPSGGLFAWCGVGRLQPLGLYSRGREAKLSMDLSAAYSDGPLGKSAGPVFVRLTLSGQIAISAQLTFCPSVVIQSPIGGQERFQQPLVTQSEVVWGAALSGHF